MDSATNRERTTNTLNVLGVNFQAVVKATKLNTALLRRGEVRFPFYEFNECFYGLYHLTVAKTEVRTQIPKENGTSLDKQISDFFAHIRATGAVSRETAAEGLRLFEAWQQVLAQSQIFEV